MKHSKPIRRPQLLATALATLLAPLPAWAQHADHMPPPPSVPQEAQSDKPEEVKQEAPEEMNHSTMDHPAMDHSAMDHSTMDLPATVDPLTPIPEVTDADRAAAVAPEENHPVHDNGIFHYVLFNRLEAWDADAGTGLAWEGQSWIGTDLNRLWLRSEGEQVNGELESADLDSWPSVSWGLRRTSSKSRQQRISANPGRPRPGWKSSTRRCSPID